MLKKKSEQTRTVRVWRFFNVFLKAALPPLMKAIFSDVRLAV